MSQLLGRLHSTLARPFLADCSAVVHQATSASKNRPSLERANLAHARHSRAPPRRPTRSPGPPASTPSSALPPAPSRSTACAAKSAASRAPSPSPMIHDSRSPSSARKAYPTSPFPATCTPSRRSPRSAPARPTTAPWRYSAEPDRRRTPCRVGRSPLRAPSVLRRLSLRLRPAMGLIITARVHRSTSLRTSTTLRVRPFILFICSKRRLEIEEIFRRKAIVGLNAVEGIFDLGGVLPTPIKISINLFRQGQDHLLGNLVGEPPTPEHSRHRLGGRGRNRPRRIMNIDAKRRSQSLRGLCLH